MPIFSFMTPYGSKGALYVFKALDALKTYELDISELKAIPLKSILGVIFVFVLLLTLYLNYTRSSNIYINFYSISVLLLCIMNARHFILMYIVLLFLTINLVQNKPNKQLPTFVTMLFCILTAFISLSAISTKNTMSYFIQDEINLVEQLNIPKDSKILNTINIGGYLEYSGYNTFIDMRPELYTADYGNNRLKEYMYSIKSQSYLFKDDIRTFIDDFDYIITSYSDEINVVLAQLKYEKILDTNSYFVWKIP
jgi:hypothetical protein